MIFFRSRKRREELDARVADATAEAEKSRERLRHAREHVIRPLQERGHRNHFAELIRASLTEGHGVR